MLRARPGADKAEQSFVFAEGLRDPFGLAFYPAANPQWLYVGMTGKVVRFPYRDGDTRARGPAETVIANIPVGGGHWTRDIAFSADGTKLFLAIGSGSNDAEGMSKRTTDEIAQIEREAGVKGVSWAEEKRRAVVMVSDPDGANQKVYAAGIRNCSGLTVNPRGGDLWCTTNERDLLGDNLVPDYSTRVKPGQFYGWPWFYIGAHQDPRHTGERSDLAGTVATPEVLYQAHSAPLQMTFYDAAGPAAFPKAYDGDAFVAMHGSWNRSDRTGYKVVRLRMRNGAPTGEYEDFVTGFVTDAGTVWGRPVGVTESKDGALLVSDDAGSLVWRIAYRAGASGAK